MFEGIKRRWAEARGTEARKDVDDALLRWDLMNSSDKHFVASAFSNGISDIPTSLSDKEKAEVAKGIMKAARAAFNTRGDNLMAHTSRVSAYGGALVALYLECQTLPGDDAAAVVRRIEDWQSHF